MRTAFLYLLVVALVLAFLVAPWVRDGMANDGVLYAALANNLAQDRSDFWSPALSETLNRRYYAEPPLVFGLQSLFFRVLGDHFLVERLYDALLLLLAGGLMYWLWALAIGTDERRQRLFALPLVLWLLNPDTLSGYANNRLEITQNVFTLAAVLLLWLYYRRGRRRWPTLAAVAVLVSAGTYAAGLQALFPLLFPLLYTIINQQWDWRRVIIDMLVLTAGTMLIIDLPLLHEPAREYLRGYWEQAGGGSGGQPWMVLAGFLVRYSPVLVITAFSLWQARRRGVVMPVDLPRPALLLLSLAALAITLGLAGCCPERYDLMPAHPLLALGLATLLLPVLLRVRESEWVHDQLHLINAVGLVLALAATGYVIHEIGSRRPDDAYLLQAVHSWGGHIPEETVIDTHPAAVSDTLASYFARYYYISLDPKNEPQREYFLSPLDSLPPEGYLPLETTATDLQLYQKIQ